MFYFCRLEQIKGDIMGFLDFLKKIFNNDKHNPKIIVQNFSKIYKSSEPLEVGLYYKEQALQNEKIKIEVNNKTYERKTDENGIAKLNINLNVGKYRANIKFDGTDEYNSATGYADIYVNPKIKKTIANSFGEVAKILDPTISETELYPLILTIC